MKVKVFKQIFGQVMVLLVIFSLVLPNYSWAKKTKRRAQIVITKTDGTMVEGELLSVKEDSILLMSNSGNNRIEINVNEIYKIRINKKSQFGKGVGNFPLIGALIGLVAGVIGGLDNKIYLRERSPEEVKKILKKLNKYARFKNLDPDKLKNTLAINPPNGIIVTKKTEKNNASVVLKKVSGTKLKSSRFKRFHLTGGPSYYKSQSTGVFKKLLNRSGFGDIEPAKGISFFGFDFGSTESNDFPMVMSDPKISFGDFCLEYSVSKKFMIGIGSSYLGRHEVHGYRFILLYDNYYSEMFLRSEFSGNFYYMSGAWMKMPDAFIKKTAVKIGGAVGFSSTSTNYKLSQHQDSDYSGREGEKGVDKKSFALMVFVELKYFLNQTWSVGLNMNYRHIPVKIPKVHLSSEYLSEIAENGDWIYEPIQVDIPESKISSGGIGVWINLGIHF